MLYSPGLSWCAPTHCDSVTLNLYAEAALATVSASVPKASMSLVRFMRTDSLFMIRVVSPLWQKAVARIGYLSTYTIRPPAARCYRCLRLSAQAELFLQAFERGRSGTQCFKGDARERDLCCIVQIVHVAGVFVDKQEAGRDTTGFHVVLDVSEDFAAIAGIVISGNLGEVHHGSVMHRDGRRALARYGRLNRFDRQHHVGFRHSDHVLARVRVALGRTLMVVEGHARRNDVDQSEAAVCDACFEDRDQLFLVA